VDGQAVGYGRVLWFEEPDGTFAAGHREYLAPEWRGKGILRALLSVNEARAREMAARHAKGPQQRMGTIVADTEEHRTSILEANGYERVRWYYEMIRDLREPIKVLRRTGGGTATRPSSVLGSGWSDGMATP
jgi:GNAT superfamily N-acetyltransferase